ncbi:MAG: sulfatase-like hydrolase/transferase [Candidatus Eisenbacteria bacterium]|nr:sulfatase-like hydrolase/transferase [Candidatus Eisenbacteria bacterium]
MRRVLLRWILVTVVVAATAGCGGNGDEPAGEGPSQVLIFAVDAATWNVLTPMIEAGELPTFARLVNEGTYGVLQSGEPVQSPQMWTSIATGVVPEKHGITRFTAEVPGTDREVPVTSNMRLVKAFWNILSEHDVSVGIVGWWPSWPSEKVNGFMVAQRAWPMNWSLHGIPFGAARDERGRLLVEEFPGRTYPEELYDEFVPYIMTEEDVTVADLDRFFSDSRFTDPRRQFHARWVYAKDKTFADAGLALFKRYEPEVFAVYLQGTDVTAHYYWGYRREEGFEVSNQDARLYGSVVENYYRFVDGVIAKYLENAADDAAVIVVSDHGFETKRDLKERWERGERIRTKEGNKDVPWDHALEGAYIVSGPGIRKGHHGEQANVVDVTPTLLAYLGLPVAEDMDGEPMLHIFEEPFLAANPVETVPTFETGEPKDPEAPLESPMDEGIKEKLRSLGYIE